MNLYTQQSSNLRKTWLLMTFFFSMVITIGWVFSQIAGNPGILYIAVVFSIVMNVVSYWFSDKIVLRMHSAQPVEIKSHPELYRVLENLTITAGLPMPKFYLIQDSQPNAFATGRNAEHAVVCVTSGLLNITDRSELEGVLAHELSHIGNRDMLLSTVAVVLVGFISIISNMFMHSFVFGNVDRRDNDRGNSAGILMIVGIVLSMLAPLFASLLQLAISRRREFQADTSGVLLTRYPEGLASALEKISHFSKPLTTANNATAHLFLQNPFGANNGGEHKIPWLIKIFSTHPPIKERIEALKGMKSA